MGNLFELFIYVIIGVLVLGFLFGPKGKRVKAAKDDLKTEFPGIIKLFFLAGILVIIFTAIRGY